MSSFSDLLNGLVKECEEEREERHNARGRRLVREVVDGFEEVCKEQARRGHTSVEIRHLDVKDWRHAAKIKEAIEETIIEKYGSMDGIVVYTNEPSAKSDGLKVISIQWGLTGLPKEGIG